MIGKLSDQILPFLASCNKSTASDHGVKEVKPYYSLNVGSKILFLVTGGIAAYKSPSVIRALRMYGYTVHVAASPHALEIVGEKALEWASTNPVITGLTGDSEHLVPYDGCIVYPATYNCIGKAANGIADDLISTMLCGRVCRKAPVLFVPTMHKSMINSIFVKNVRKLESYDCAFCANLNGSAGKMEVPETPEIIADFIRLFSTSVFKNRSILITAGPTPVVIDPVRRITNVFSGKTGIAIAKELYMRGANVKLLQSSSGIRPPPYIPCRLHSCYEEYLHNCVDVSMEMEIELGIYSAAVADYKPASVSGSKLPSKMPSLDLHLVPTEKVIDVIQARFPQQKIVSFKLETTEDLSVLGDIAYDRLNKGHLAVVGNRMPSDTDIQQWHMFHKVKESPLGLIQRSLLGPGRDVAAYQLCQNIERLLD